MTKAPLRLVMVAMLGLAGSLAIAQSDPFGQLGGPSGPPEGGAVTLRVVPDRSEVSPGGQLVVAVEFSIADTWHTWPAGEPIGTPALPEWQSLPTRLDVTVEGATVGPIQWPKAHLTPTRAVSSDPVELLMYTGTQVVYVPLVVDGDAGIDGAGELSIGVNFFYQACDETICDRPRDIPQTIVVGIVADASGASAAEPALFAGFDASAFDDVSAWGGDGSATGTQNSGENGSADVGVAPGSLLGFNLGSSLVMLAIGAFLGGAILNLTPCVLPVIPIKIIALTQHAGEDRKRMFVLGLSMAAGVTAFWLALGIPTAFITAVADPSRLFGFWFVTVPLGVIIVLLALGLMGLYTISLPQSAYAINPKADNIQGSFLFGVMTGVLGLPCFGVAAGGIIPIAASLGARATIVIFAAIGLGMASPYLVLAAFPKLVDKLPRTGPASELVKQLLGLLLAGFGLFFLGTGVRSLVKTYPYTGEMLHWYALAATVIAAGLWLVYQTIKITKSPARRAVFSLLGLAIATGGVYFSISRTGFHRVEYEEHQAAIAEARALTPPTLLARVWNEYSPALLEVAKERDMVVFIDFTADWCINCKVFKALVLDKEPVRSALRAEGVAMFEVDLTGSNPEGDELLGEFGRIGIPTWIVLGPGLAEARVINAYTPAAVLGALEDASATPIAKGP